MAKWTNKELPKGAIELLQAKRDQLPYGSDYFSDDVRDFVMAVLMDLLTEERTDQLIQALVKRLPFWLRWFPVANILDHLLPDWLIVHLGRLLDEASGRPTA